MDGEIDDDGEAVAAPALVPSKVDRKTTPTAALAALGIVYGDLGTSPLYTVQTIVGASGGQVDPTAALGILSLVVWSLVLVISLKYCLFVMRADNNGEGGILALMSLIGVNGRLGALTACGLFGAALIYGDGVLTPAISVLSALEGINVVTPALKPYIMPMAVVVLLALFGFQAMGTAKIGRVFGPVMLLWFIVIGVLGAIGVVSHPGVVVALNPAYAVGFLASHGWGSLAVLGGVFLALTGGEALYADMGHIGRNPIRTSWYGIVLPALLLCYAGQTAFLIENPKLDGNPFFHLAPGWAVLPLVLLATCSTIIASQAIITGAFSLTRQAMQLGWFPGMPIRQTSAEEYGQIYVPFVNWTMMTGTVLLTVAFGSSDSLAGAYGTAVSTTMLLTTVLLYNAMRYRWGWWRALAVPLCGLFLIVDLGFFSANLLKIREGGWIPLLFGGLIFFVMSTWRSGVHAIKMRLLAAADTPEQMLLRLERNGVPRIPGTAVFLSRNTRPVAPIMVQHILQMGALHEVLVSLTVVFEEVPRVPRDSRVQVEKVFDGFWHLTVHWGFMDIPSLPEALAIAREHACPLDLDHAVYFGSRDVPVRSRDNPLMPRWQEPVFAFLYTNSIHLVDRFDLPPKQFVELGRQVEI